MNSDNIAGAILFLCAVAIIGWVVSSCESAQWYTRMRHLADDLGGQLHCVTEEMRTPPFSKRNWQLWIPSHEGAKDYTIILLRDN